PDMTLEDVETAASMVKEAAHESAHIIFGASIDESLEDEFRITVIATQFDKKPTLQMDDPAEEQPGEDSEASEVQENEDEQNDPIDFGSKDDLFEDLDKIFKRSSERRGKFDF
ncbi:MAG: cell division protein FtsZ, partial [Clostridia bacterium]|nr:cell division protein FtsZ [Clostridia bacterium]